MIEKDYSILRYYLTPHSKDYDKKPILWPAYAYRVVAPITKERQMNILQKAVIGLCDAGIVSLKSISELLNIDEELAGYIVLELQSEKHISQTGSLTDTGRSMLNAGRIENKELVTGYVFKDPFINKLWPRFVTNLDFAEWELNENGNPILIEGNRTIWPSVFTIKNEMSYPTPEPIEILDSIRRHSKDTIRWKNNIARMEDNEVGDFDYDSLEISRIALISEIPIFTFLYTWLYVPSDEYDWYVTDPFGLGYSVFLKRIIEKRLFEDDKVKNKIEELLGERHGGISGYNEIMEEIESKALSNLNTYFDKINSDIFQYLHSLEIEMVKAEEAGIKCKTHQINNVLGQARKALEAVFNILNTEYASKGLWEDLSSQDNKYNRLFLERILKNIGFREPFPEPLFRIDSNKVKSITDYDTSRSGLRPRVLVSILAAARNAEHPLRKLSSKMPNALLEVESISNLAGEAVHASETLSSSELDNSELRKLAMFVYEATKILLIRDNL